LVAVYTQPPRPAGRGKGLSLSPVHRRAEELGLPVLKPVSLKGDDEKAEFAALGADAAIVAAYGLILPKAVLAAPRLGCINIHASILPRWRGAAPIQRAILAGDAATGVTIMQMEAGLDTGPMLAVRETPTTGKTAGELTEELAHMGAELLLPLLEDEQMIQPVTQPELGVTYAPKIDKSEARLDFMISAPQLERQVRAFAPAPGAFFEYRGERFRILAAEPILSGPASPGTVLDDQLTISCNPGAVRPLIIQRAGKSAMPVKDFLRGFAIPKGTKLS
jgi:methionyl-tRNA formyltransferase